MHIKTLKSPAYPKKVILSVAYYEHSFIHKLGHIKNEVYTISVQNIPK